MLGKPGGGMNPPQYSSSINSSAYGLTELKVVAGDFYGDDSAELLIQASSSGFHSIMFTQNGVGLEQAQLLGQDNGASVSSDLGAITVQDVNKDGKDDLVLLNGENIVRAILGSPSGFIVSEEDPTADLVLRDFTNALMSGNSQKALNYIEPTSRGRYSRAFSDLGSDIKNIATGFSSPTKLSATNNYAELILTQVVNGQQYVHICSFIKNHDGRWYINSL